MKKKMLLVAVAISALTLSACVDDNESQSVTDVRTAKTEQLKSIAAMNNAEAAAKKVLADAEAILKAAQAEAEKAAAAKANAEAEKIKKETELIELQKEAATLKNEADKIENQKAQAQLEAQLAQLEVIKKQAEARLQEIADEMELQQQRTAYALAQLQLQLKQAQQNLLDYDKQLAEAQTQAEKQKIEQERQELQIFAQKYSNAVTDLINAQMTLSNYKKALVTLETGLADAQATKQKAIAENNNQIAIDKMQIAKYKEYTNYTANITELENKQKELSANYNLAWDKSLTAQQTYSKTEVNTDGIDGAWKAIESDEFFFFMTNKRVQIKLESGDSYYFNIGIVTQHIANGNYSYYAKRYTFTSGSYSSTTYIGDSLYVNHQFDGTDVRQVEIDITNGKKYFENLLTSDTTSLAIQQKAYNGEATINVGGIEKSIRNAVDSTAYLKNAYTKESDQTKKANYWNLYQSALTYEVSLKNNIENLASSVNWYKAYILAYDKSFDLFKNAKNYAKTLQTKIDAYNDANIKAYANKVSAWISQEEKYSNYLAINTELSAVNEILLYGTNSAKTITQWIANLEEEIITLEKDNADVSSINSREEAINYQKARITAQEVFVKAKEVAANDAKTDLNAAMPKSE